MPRSIDPLRQLEIYRSFFEKASDLLLIVDSQGIIQNANPMWETALGYSVQETIDQPIINFIHPDDIALRMKAAAQTLEGEEQTSLEIRYLTKSGKVRWFRWRANAFKGFIFGIGQDVTAERASKIKLEDTNSLLSNALVQERQWRTMAEAQQVRLRDLFNQVPMIAAVFSGPDHMIELANPSFYHLVNFRNVMGRPAFEALPMMDDVTARTLRRVFESGERFVGRNFAMTADWAASGEPTEKLFHLIFEPIKNSSGQVEAIWSLAFDVTEQAELEAKLRSTERMASLGEMAAGVGHEINNPLAYSLLNLDLLTEKLGSTFGSRDEIPLLLKELLRKSVDGLDRVRDIVKGLKAFSRQDESHLEPLDIREPLRIALNFTANETRHRAKVITEFEDAALVVANTGRLTQVFTNLLVNAAQALDIDRANENTIRVKVFLSEDRKVIVDVIDSGCGIPAHLLPRVFEPFYTSKPVGVGTGLGLSICHGIISNFGGDIQIASEVGKGTRVRI
jgi:PAS domain S-box-containing protein